MEIEDKLKSAATWHPDNEMPKGLERRALAGRNRPPLRPIGISRPRSVLFATAMAGFASTFILVQVGPKLSEQLQPTAAPQIKRVTPATPEPKRPRQVAQRPDNNTEVPRKPETPITPVQKPSKLKQVPSRPKLELPRQLEKKPPTVPQRLAVAADDSVVLQSRVAVEQPAYSPAYYAEPSADGASMKYTPVAVALDDPDVIVTNPQKEN